MKTMLKLLTCAVFALYACGQPPSPTPQTSDASGEVQTIDHPLSPLGAAIPIDAPAVADTRTPLQLKTAACHAADGSWACKNVAQPHTFALGTSPTIPTSWTIPAWFIDPTNSTGTASDSNDCVTAVTPCLTWQEINSHRWGCVGNPRACPRLRQSTAIEFLSSQTNNSDPVIWYPTIENGAVIQLFGPLGAAQQIATGTLSNVTAKNRSTPQLLLAQSGATAVGQFVVNTTHPSRAWTYALSSGSIYKMTQPEVAAVVPSSFSCGAEVNTWANSDAVTVYQPVKINIVDVSPIFAELNGGFSNYAAYIYNLTILDPGTFSGVHMAFSELFESFSQKFLELDGNAYIGWNFCNAVGGQGVRGGSTGQNLVWHAGAFSLSAQNSDMINTTLTDDVIVAGTSFIGYGGVSGGVTFGSGGSPVYIETGKSLNIGATFDGSGGIWWGPGTINVAGTGRFFYTAPAATNLLVGALQLNGVAAGHSIFTLSNVDTPCGGITLNKANLDAVASATCASTGFGGLAYNPGGASFSALTGL